MNGDELRIDVRRGGALYDETGDQRVNGTSFSLRAPTPASSGVCQNESRTTDDGLGLTSVMRGGLEHPAQCFQQPVPTLHRSILHSTLAVRDRCIELSRPSAPCFAVAASPLYRRWYEDTM